MHSAHGCSPVSSGHWETSEALTGPSLPSASLGMVLAYTHARTREVSVHAEPLIRSRTLGGRALSSMCGVACFVSCCHRAAAATAAAANGLFSMSLSWLRGRFSLFLIRRPDSVSHVLFSTPAHVYY